MLRLYDYLPSGNGYKVRLLLTQLVLPFERIEKDIIKGETRTAEFLAKFPNGRIPAVEFDDGRLLSESDAIIAYFAENTALMPEDRFERAQVMQWLFFEQNNHEPWIAGTRFLVMYPQVEDDRRKLLPMMRQRGYDALGVMETHLAGGEFFAAKRYTIADLALYAYTHVADEGGFDLAPYRRVRAWLERVRSQPHHIPITQG